MRLLHWCMLGVTVLLLMCEVAISQLCKSLILLVDGSHTLFVLMHVALPLPQTSATTTTTPPLSSVDASTPPPHPPPSAGAAPPAEVPGKSLPEKTIFTISDQLPAALPDSDAAVFHLHQLSPSVISPAAPNCGLSFPGSRVQAVGFFLSALLLASLCISYLLEILSFFVEPRPVQHPLLMLSAGAAALLYKMLLFGLNWDRLRDWRVGGHQPLQSEADDRVNRKVQAEERAAGWEDGGHAGPARAADDALHRGTLVLCNPQTSSIPDSESQTRQQQPDVRLQDAESADMVAHQKVRRARRGPQPVGLLSFIFAVQGLFTSLLALINSLVMLLLTPQFPHSNETCNPLVYLDPVLSLLAVITLIATTLPEVYRYGLLLLQAAPPHLCVSDVGRRIASVPGVQAVHDLHIWQLNDALVVASVHVHCFAGFSSHRCADVMSGVSQVLHSVGVNCCTVQPEFVSPGVSSAGSGGDASPVIHREDPSPPPLLTCSLACRKACAASMCCSLLEEPQSSLAPPAGETKDEPQTLIIENTFL